MFTQKYSRGFLEILRTFYKDLLPIYQSQVFPLPPWSITRMALTLKIFLEFFHSRATTSGTRDGWRRENWKWGKRYLIQVPSKLKSNIFQSQKSSLGFIMLNIINSYPFLKFANISPKHFPFWWNEVRQVYKIIIKIFLRGIIKIFVYKREGWTLHWKFNLEITASTKTRMKST